ncbi:hypothetical protein Tco_0373750 [Tanacetum coccineum]
MKSFLLAVVNITRGDKLLMLLEQQENTHLEQVEATQGNNGLSSVTIAKGRVILPSSVLSPREKGMKRGLPDTQTYQTDITHNAAYQANDLDAYDSDYDELNSANIALIANLSRNGSDALTEKEVLKKPFLSEESFVVKRPKLYDGNVILKMDAIVIPDSDETLMLCEESRSKMLLKNKIQWLEHAYWKATLVPPLDPSPSSTTNKVEVPKEFPKVSMVNTSLKELKRHLAVIDQEQGVRLSASASRSQPSGNTSNDKIQQTPSSNSKNKETIVLESESPKPVVNLVYSRKPRKNKNTESVSKTKVVQIVLWYLDSGCSKHMTGDRSQLTNFISKFLGTVKFRNDQVAKIMGYGDYQIRNVTISRVYYVEGLGHNLFFCGTIM